jgi:hypothetical protein
LFFCWGAATAAELEMTRELNVISDELMSIEQQKKEVEKVEKQEKGSVPFYIEKYGKWILIYGVGAYLVATYIKSRK